MKLGEDRRADVVVLTAIRLEYDAVRKVDAGAALGSSWEAQSGPTGLPVAFRSFIVEHGQPLRVAVALAPDMGAPAAVSTLLPLVNELKPRCIAMCGVCAGRRDKGVRLGDVVAGDRVFYHDTGKQHADQVQQDLKTYNLRDDWKVALQGMDAVARFRDEAWFQARPLTTEWREYRALIALRDGGPEPWLAVEPELEVEEWKRILDALRAQKLLASRSSDLTEKGRRVAAERLFEHQGELPDLSPTGTFQRFRLHVAPIGSGARVVEDERLWTFVSQTMRKTMGIEMEAASIGELAHHQRQHQLDWVVMKGVMDFADHGRDDHFKEFAARASAECLLWFLREHVPTDHKAGVDDLLSPAGASTQQAVGESLGSAGRGRPPKVARVSLDAQKIDALDRASLSAALDRMDAAHLAELRLALDGDALQRELCEIWSDAPSSLDNEPVPAELTPEWRQYLQDRRDDEMRLRIALPVSLDNLSEMLTAACEGISASLASSVWLGHKVAACLQRLTSIVLCQFWEGVSQCTPRARILDMRSVNGASVLALVAKLENLQRGSLGSAPVSYMHAHELPEADLERVELRGRTGIASGSAWVPVTTILKDTRKYWQFGASPPSTEILAQDWVRFFIPGLAAYYVRVARNLGQRLRDAQPRVSLRIDAYAHLGPP